MWGFKKYHNKQKKLAEKIETLNKGKESQVLSPVLADNIAVIKQLFKDNDTLQERWLENNVTGVTAWIVYCDGMVDSAMMSDSLIKPFMLSEALYDGDQNLLETLTRQVLFINDACQTGNIKEIIEAVTYGDTFLLVDGVAQGLLLNTKGFQSRSVDEPENEKTLSGPREGFTECLMTNLSLIRRKLRTNELKMKYKLFGRQSRTKACICYIEGLIDPKILDELYYRLDQLAMDSVLDTQYITEHIQDAQYSLFHTTGYTERPDVIAGKLLEGRIAVFVDGTPVVMTLPFLFIENFHSSEDYYLTYYYTSFSRMLRILGFVLSILTPGLYVAIVAFHPQTLPTPLLVNIAIESQSAPLPTALEACVMLILFNILREAGIRMPNNIGQALSIVGALVLGQAAVEAELIAAPMIIVIALTGITSLLVPKMNAAVVFIRFSILLLASTLGFYGLILGVSTVLIHLLGLRSFGINYIHFGGSLRYQEIKDIVFRAPWWQMIMRAPAMSANIRRQKKNKRN